MGNDDLLLWGEDGGGSREIRGKSGIKRDRYGVVKFPKSLCADCNNHRSQPFDEAYDQFSDYVASNGWLRKLPGVNFQEIYGADWEAQTLNLARYYGKHFGCRLVRTSVPVPASLRAFLDGATDMPDSHMGLITTDEVHQAYGSGLSISPDCIFVDRAITEITGCTLAAYIGAVGVRYQWCLEGIPEDERSQFFHYPMPLINCFHTEADVAMGEPRPQGRLARFFQWINKPSD